jgi:hypothetical protein
MLGNGGKNSRDPGENPNLWLRIERLLKEERVLFGTGLLLTLVGKLFKEEKSEDGKSGISEKLHGARLRFVIMLSCSSDKGKARDGGIHAKLKV